MVELSDTASFTYRSCVDKVQRRRTKSGVAKFRLLVRHCLAKKCLHVPLEVLADSTKKIYYTNSILGDEILRAIFLSVILQCGRLNFELDLGNDSFLEETWQRPIVAKLQIVPCRTLGVAVSFCENRAIIVHVEPGGVVAETGQVSRGDILDRLNGMEIDKSCKGRLNQILRSRKGQPVEIVVVKAYTPTGEILPAILKMLRELQLDLTAVKEIPRKLSGKSGGFKATYLGMVDIGGKGGVKQIDPTIKQMLRKPDLTKTPVIFEIGEMSVKVTQVEPDQVGSSLVLKHSYMQISSCGSMVGAPNYIAYIAGNDSCESAETFICHVFHVVNTEDACTILQSIGQGFHRTHFAV